MRRRVKELLLRLRAVWKPSPHFITATLLDLHGKRPELIAFQIRSKRQLHSNPEKWYMSIEEMFELKEHPSPIYYLRADDAEKLARNLLEAAVESRQKIDDA